MSEKNPGYLIRLDKVRRLRITDWTFEIMDQRYGVDNFDGWNAMLNEAEGPRRTAMVLWPFLIDEDPKLTVPRLELILADFFGYPLRWWIRKQWVMWWIRPRQIRAAQDYAREKGWNPIINGKGA